ncbi:transporter substrate-binding domain-containing protein [Vibrio profundum]|uniref:substrate-binding periplasmic protein n=1 Tax=Vibrio profundum TaxID=2910247 RepID=UPI003D0F7F27
MKWLLLPLLFSSPTLYAQITFAAMEGFIPYSWTSSGQKTGIDIEIIQLLSKKTNIPIAVRLTPWKRVLHETKSGHVDGGIAFFKTEERENFLTYISTPLHESTYKVFVRKGEEFKFDSVADLHGKSIGKNTGFHISKEFNQANKENLIHVEEASMELNIKKLHGKRISALVGNQQEVYYLLSKLGLSDSIVALQHPLFPSRGAYLVISNASKTPNKEKLINKLSDTLKAMKEDGLLDEIYAKYGQK